MWRPVSDWPGERACRMALYVVQPRFEGDRAGAARPGARQRPLPWRDPGRRRRLVRGDHRLDDLHRVGEVAPVDAPGRPSSSPPTTRRPGRWARRGRSPRRARPTTTTPRRHRRRQPGHPARAHGQRTTRRSCTRTRSTPPTRRRRRPSRSPSCGPGATARTRPHGRGRQTYVSLVCTPDDALVIVFRQSRRRRRAEFGGEATRRLRPASRGGGASSDAGGSSTAVVTRATPNEEIMIERIKKNKVNFFISFLLNSY